MHKYSIVTCARWEADHVMEWALYHKKIGFDHIYFYSNDDDPKILYKELLPLALTENFLTYLHFPFQGQQTFMYMHFFDKFAHETEWVLFLDVDEFLNLKGQTIDDFIKEKSLDFDSVCFNWLMFGNNGFTERPKGDVLTNYYKRQSSYHPYTKNIVKTSKIDPKLLRQEDLHGFWHSWNFSVSKSNGKRGSETFSIKECNVIGDGMSEYYSNFPESANKYLVEKGSYLSDVPCINHYSIKSVEDFMRRERRGLGGEFVGQSHWGSVFRQGSYDDYLAAINDKIDTELKDYWEKISSINSSMIIAEKPRLRLISSGKKATQSSICQFSIGKTCEEDASRAVSGAFWPDYAFHTECEANPWWMIDLEDQYQIKNIRVFNRITTWGSAERAKKIELLVSKDGQSWEIAFVNDHNRIFGGVDGNPLVVSFSNGCVARFVKLSLNDTNYFHLNQIEIYID